MSKMKYVLSVEARMYRKPFSIFGFRERLNKPRRSHTRKHKTIIKKSLRFA